MKILPVIRNAFATKTVDKHNLKWLFYNIPTRNNEDNFIITSFKTPKGIFTDSRAAGGGARIQIGKSELNIDTNGKVLSYKKPFFKSLNKLVDKAVELVNFISTNMENPAKVQKSTVELLTFSKTQVKKLSKML